MRALAYRPENPPNVAFGSKGGFFGLQEVWDYVMDQAG